MKERKLVYGVGINDADYKVELKETIGYTENGKQIRKKIWSCPFYIRWRAMLQRCYSLNYGRNCPTYAECYVTPEWHYFMNFRAWMEKQDWEGKHLDKDLLVLGNKIYGPENCIFISNQLNAFINEKRISQNNLLPGVSIHKATNKYCAQIYNPFTKKPEWLGLYESEEKAHKVYWDRKCYFASLLLTTETNKSIINSLVKRYGG